MRYRNLERHYGYHCLSFLWLLCTKVRGLTL